MSLFYSCGAFLLNIARNSRPDIRHLSDDNIAEISSGQARSSGNALATDTSEPNLSTTGRHQDSSQLGLSESSSAPSMSMTPSASGVGPNLTASTPTAVEQVSAQTIRPKLMSHGRSKSVSNRLSFSPGFGASSLSTLSLASCIQRMTSLLFDALSLRWNYCESASASGRAALWCAIGQADRERAQGAPQVLGFDI